MNEISHQNPEFNQDSDQVMTRRKFAGILVKALALSPLVAACATRVDPAKISSIPTMVVPETSVDPFYGDPFSEIPERSIDLQFISPRNSRDDLEDNFDPNYLERLIELLKQPIPLARENKLNAIILNLSWLIAEEEETALKIDESGYYLTAGHGLSARGTDLPISKPARVYDPNSGQLSVVKSFAMILSSNQDIGLFYAPNGKTRKPVIGVSFNTTPPRTGEGLWMHPLLIQVSKGLSNRGILHGVVDQELTDSAGDTFQGFIKVAGMIPFGGSSGAPVIDSQGNIRGLEKGPILRNSLENERADYIGSTLTPIAQIDELLGEISRNRIHRLPISQNLRG